MKHRTGLYLYMQKKSICVYFMVSVMLLLVSCASPVPMLKSRMVSLAEKDHLVILMFGDELSGGDTSFDRTNSWAGMLKPRLEKLFGKRISFINSSKTHESFQTAERRLEADILSYRPDFVFLMLGRIDAFSMQLPLRTHKQNVETLLGALKKKGKFVVLITSPGLGTFPSADDETLEVFDRYIQTTRDGARLYRYPIIDVTLRMKKLLREDPAEYVSLFADNSMLNRKGKEYIGDIVYEYFREVVTEQ